MNRLPMIALASAVFGCSAQTEVTEVEGIWLQDDSIGPFTETWSVCHHFRAVTANQSWLLDIDVSSERGEFDASEIVSLVDFTGVTDRECAISLYRNNDIACEGEEPVTIPARNGDGQLRHSIREPFWESTFDLDISDLVFPSREGEIRIDRVRFSNVVYSNFCPG